MRLILRMKIEIFRRTCNYGQNMCDTGGDKTFKFFGVGSSTMFVFVATNVFSNSYIELPCRL